MLLNGINFNGWNDYSEKLTKKTTSAKNLFHGRVFENINDIEEKTEDKEFTMNDWKDKDNAQEECKTATQILVKPDGSRVLLVKVMVAGMQTTMSLKLSEETDMPNNSADTLEQLSEEGINMAELPN